LVTIDAISEDHGREMLTLSPLGASNQFLEIITSQSGRSLTLRQARRAIDGKAWRAFEVRNLAIPRDKPVAIHIVKNFDSIAIFGGEKEVPFDLRIEQADGKEVVRRDETGLATIPAKLVSFCPTNWRNLDKMPFKREEFTFPERLH
jgi:hypothetical protein